MGLFSTPSLSKAIGGAQSTIAAGQDQAKGDIDFGLDQARDGYNAVSQLFEPASARYDKGSALFADAMGLNGADGTSRARSAYATSPGYTFGLDQGLQALARARAAGGSLASGGADADAMKFAVGTAQQDYGNWLSNLGGYDSKYMGALGARATPLMAGAGAAMQAGLARGNVDSEGSRASAGVLLDGAKAQAQMKQKTQANTLGSIIGGAKLISGGLGSFSGGGGAFSSIFGDGGPDLSAGSDSQWI